MIASVKPSPKFTPGQLVHHKHYGYRGVVVAVDESCHADDSWYQTNQTQPNRNQPWYHVLVDQTTTTTYVAESNLEPEVHLQPVSHPLVPHFFSDFADGRHIRNKNPWPGA